MSVVVAIVDKGVTYLGADTQTSSGDSKENTAMGDFAKVSIFPNGLLVGVCGLVKGHQLLTINQDEFTLGEEGLTKELIVNKFIPIIKKIYEEEKILNDDGDSPCSFIFAWKDVVYSVLPTFDVYRHRHYATRGCGGDYAIVGLDEEEKPVEERVLNALRLSAKISKGVGAPYILINTKECQYKEIDE